MLLWSMCSNQQLWLLPQWRVFQEVLIRKKYLCTYMKKETATIEELRSLLLEHLDGGNAHKSFDEIVGDFPVAHSNDRPAHVPYSFWHLLEHVRFAQRDFLNFITDPDYAAPEWPNDYWPKQNMKASEAAWKKTIKQFHADREKLRRIAREDDLFSDVRNGTTVLRELLLCIDHTAYHLGAFLVMRREMGLWKD
jgi:uncharacterized damage-inducible protein DinB